MMHHQQLGQMEKEIIKRAQKYFADNLVCLMAEGSYAAMDYVEGYSDYDLLIIVKDINRKAEKFNLDDLSKKFSIKVQCSIDLYQDILNRIKNNNKASRFINNLELIIIKKHNRLLAGKDIKKQIPDVRGLIKRDLGAELRSIYLYAVNPDKRWNIFIREPRKWCNYAINMANALLLSRGMIVKKDQIPGKLKQYHPRFKGIDFVKKALELRKTKKILHLNKSGKQKFNKEFRAFLEAYRDYVF